MPSADGIGGVAVDAELAQRDRVDPDRVVVVRIEVHGNVGDNGVEHRGGGRAARHGVEQPPAPEQAGRLGVGVARRAQPVVDLGKRAGVGEADLAERLAHHHEVRVGVDEAGHHDPAAEVEDRGIRPGERGRLGVGADERDASAVGDDRLGPGRLVGGEHAAVRVDGAGHAATSSATAGAASSVRWSRLEMRATRNAGTARTKLATPSTTTKPW